MEDERSTTPQAVNSSLVAHYAGYIPANILYTCTCIYTMYTKSEYRAVYTHTCTRMFSCMYIHMLEVAKQQVCIECVLYVQRLLYFKHNSCSAATIVYITLSDLHVHVRNSILLS